MTKSNGNEGTYKFGALHPLGGANYGTLSALKRQVGALTPSGRRRFRSARWFAALRAPASAMDRIRSRGALNRQESRPAPIFILGHWRSGTTHLYNLLNEAPQFGCVTPLATGLPWDLLGIAQWFRPLLEKTLPKERLIDRIPVTPRAPQEDEIAIANMQTVSFYHALYFPKAFQRHFDRGLFFEGVSAEERELWKRRFQYFVDRLYIGVGRRRVVIKNPAHTSRPRILREVYPDAKFVFLHRDPVRVFHSMRNFYAKLLPELALQDYEALDIDEIILSGYERMMDAYWRQTRDLPSNQLIELDYEALSSRPLDTLASLYRQLELDGFDSDRAKFVAYLEGIQDYKKNAYPSDEALDASIRRRLSRFLELPFQRNAELSGGA